ncbi:MBL fold metallo-hydrolase [Blautia sp. HCP3S3_H10_1]|uniref:MBL fold metallo-hydrolase n=1 Tax=unclassified Blautia TaxID=2648079 RepID=UPI003F8DAB09
METEFYKWEPLADGVFHIQDLFGDYMYLVEGTQKAALIDTGMGFPGLRKLVEKLTDKPVIVLNTHGHLDHIGGNDEFDTVYLYQDDFSVYEKHRQASYRAGVIAGMNRELNLNLTDEVLQVLSCDRVERAFISESSKEAGKQRLVAEKMECGSGIAVQGKAELRNMPLQIDLGGRVLEVLHTPGHTKGSVCFYDRKNEILFSGDTVCSMGVMLNFTESVPVEEFMKSICFLKAQVGKCKVICPGHHKIPLDFSYFQKYLDCGQLVLAHPEMGVAEESACGRFFRLHYEDVSLTYVK